MAPNTGSFHPIKSAACLQEEENPPPPPPPSLVALLGTVLKKLLAGLVLQPGCALGRHAVLQLGHVLIGLKPYKKHQRQESRRKEVGALWREERARLPVSRGICPPLPVHSPSFSRLE